MLLLPAIALANTSGIKISEIAASPTSGFEWVEITNTGSAPVDLANWKFFEDNTNHGLKAVRGGSVLAPGGYAVIAQDATKLLTKYPNLNQVFDSSWSSIKESGEYIAIKNNSNILEEGFTYLPAPKGFLARVDLFSDDYSALNWRELDQPTIGEKNVFASLPPISDPAPATVSSSPTAPLVMTPSSTLPVVKNTATTSTPAPAASVVTIPQITLIITVPPGMFGSRTAYGETAEGVGYEIYSYYSKFPSLMDGDKVNIRGEISITNLLHRIKIKTADDITKIGTATIAPIDAASEDLNNNFIGRLVEVNGTLLEIKGRKQFIVEYDGHELETVLKTNTGLSLPKTEEGSAIRVRGIIGFRDGAFILYPRFSSDLFAATIKKDNTVQAATISNDTVAPPAAPIIPSPQSTTTHTARTVGLTLLLLGVSSFGALLIRHRDKLFSAKSGSAFGGKNNSNEND